MKESEPHRTIQEEQKNAGIMTDIVPDAREQKPGDAPLLLINDSFRPLIETRSGATPEELKKELLDILEQNHPGMDVSVILKAAEYAEKYHAGQLRKSGEPYIIHPFCVAIILAGMDMDRATISAALLHDVVEDTGATLAELEAEFSPEIAELVDGVTKLTNLSYDLSKIEQQAENLRKMFIAMAKDIRVIIIKLADRLHNLRTLQYQSREKQIEKSRETLDIYSPIADRLGISKMKVELDDLSLKYLEPAVYDELKEKISLKREERDALILAIGREISRHLREAGIKATVVGRVKHFYSIYKKMIKQQRNLEEIYDLFAVRILVDSVKDCYAALGLIHEMYKPIPGRFKDYIAMPKANMYQSLHTTLMGRDGTPFEVQIRTFEMHRIAEFGIAAHWNYKEKGSSKVADAAETDRMNWLRQVLELNKESESNKEFLDSVKTDLDLMTDEVYCFTPTGEVKSLPLGSTPIDFAYSVHTAVGNKMVGARVNGRLVPIDYEIKNGDRIEVITSQNAKGPSLDWLKIVKSAHTRNKINAWFKTEKREENIARGREAFNAYCKAKSIAPSEITKPEYIEGVLKRYAFRDWDTALAAIGHGALRESQVVGKLLETKRSLDQKNLTDEDILRAAEKTYDDRPVRTKKTSGIVVHGLHDVAVRFAHCCNPVPGDEIVGFVTRGRGITIHRTDCINMIDMSEEDRGRLIEAEWQQGETGNETYSAELRIYANNRIGMVVDISRVFTEAQIDISSLNSKTAKNGTGTIIVTFDTHGKEELAKLVEKIRQIPGIIDIGRSAG